MTGNQVTPPRTQNPPANAANEHTNVVWSGQLPAARGEVAKKFATIPIPEQKQYATELFTFLNEDAPALSTLNSEERLMTVLINLPHSDKVRLIYGLGYGVSGIGQSAPTDGKILALTGEGDQEYGPPQPITLPASTITSIDVKAPTETQLKTKLADTWPFFIGSTLPDNAKVNIMQLAPIPTFLVYDGFDKDLSAADVYERLLSLDDQDNAAIAHAKKFIQASVVKRNKNDDKSHVDQSEFIQSIPREARIWNAKRFASLFPDLTNHSLPSPQQLSSPPTIDNSLEAILRRVVTPEKSQEQGAKPTTWEDKLGMSTTELENTLIMCGLEKGEESLLPEWFAKITEKGMTDNTRNTIITKQLKTVCFEEAEIPITAPLLQTIRKRQWLANDPLATFKTAAQGLSIFAVGQLSDEEVSSINESMEALSNATQTTAKELKEASSKLTAKVPTDSHEFLELLKTFANLLFALFSSSCPLYVQIKEILRALHAYKRSAFKAIPLQTKAAILWIILLQTRHFSAGNTTLLAEFRTMKDKLVAKDMAISHAEVPSQLLPQKRKREGEIPAEGDKRGRAKESEPAVHPLIKAKFVDNVLRLAPGASLSEICKFSNTSVPILCRDTNRCILYMMGMCKSRTCQRRHQMASDTEANHVVQLLEKAIQDPTSIKPAPGQ